MGGKNRKVLFKNQKRNKVKKETVNSKRLLSQKVKKRSKKSKQQIKIKKFKKGVKI